MIPIFLAVSIITFIITNAAGNPLELIRTGIRNITPAQLESLKNFYHIDEPLYARYFLWLSDFIRGNMGTSPVVGDVAGHILPWIGTTLSLQLVALFLSLLIGIPVGVYSAKYQYSKSDVTITTVAIFGVSLPTFWLGILFIIVFSLYLGWLPSSGAVSPYPPYWWGNIFLDQIAHLILPALVLTFVSLAIYVRLIRANMLETLKQDYILAARASGLSEFIVTYKHALKNAITPIVTVVGLNFGLILSGAPALETTFTWPGLGRAFVQAALILDLPTVQAITMIITIMILILNLLTDLVYAYLDPRVKLA
jgi:ABC-type dipeptide/oligopeptide/nickel transport system permease component